MVSNPSAPLQSVGEDGHFLKGGTTGRLLRYGRTQHPPRLESSVSHPGHRVSVHFLIPYIPNNSFLPQEIGRNSFEFRAQRRWNFALEKGIDVKERSRFILRAEAQDVFNHNDWTVSNTNVVNAGGAFLAPSRLGNNGNQRSVVLWGKFEF